VVGHTVALAAATRSRAAEVARVWSQAGQAANARAGAAGARRIRGVWQHRVDPPGDGAAIMPRTAPWRPRKP